jgi:putative addiction module component (TIGR02574 family)
MPVSLEALGIDKMSIDDRLALVEAIWDSIASSTGRPPMSDALRSELDRRLDDHRIRPDDVVPWEEVKEAAQARMKR